jgi:hypothetical protein
MSKLFIPGLPIGVAFRYFDRVSMEVFEELQPYGSADRKTEQPHFPTSGIVQRL